MVPAIRTKVISLLTRAVRSEKFWLDELTNQMERFCMTQIHGASGFETGQDGQGDGLGEAIGRLLIALL
jgi:hypothetical protein